MEKTTEELLARLGLTEDNVRSITYIARRGNEYPRIAPVLSAIARLRDETASLLLPVVDGRPSDLQRDDPRTEKQEAKNKAIARAKLADMGALLALVLQ